MDRARLRIGPSAKLVVMIERPAGAVKAALTPLMKRVAISSEPSFDQAAEGGGDDEDAQRDQEDPPPSQEVGQAPAEQQETRRSRGRRR